MAGTSYDSLRLPSMTPHSVTGRLLSWLPARREWGPAGGVTIVIVIVSSRWSCIGREAGWVTKGKWRAGGAWYTTILVHLNTPRYTSYTSVHNSPTLWYTWSNTASTLHLIFQVFCVSEPCHMLLLHSRFVVHCHWCKHSLKYHWCNSQVTLNTQMYHAGYRTVG